MRVGDQQFRLMSEKIMKDILLASVRRRLKTARVLLAKRKMECPNHAQLSETLDEKFLAGLSIGHWEGQECALMEIEAQIDRQL